MATPSERIEQDKVNIHSIVHKLPFFSRVKSLTKKMFFFPRCKCIRRQTDVALNHDECCC